MDILLLNKDFEVIRVIDDYLSLIWTMRYASPGDFSMEISAMDLRKYSIRPGYLLYRKDFKQYMVIEYICLNVKVEEGRTILLKGRSLESYLDRRVCAKTTIYEGTKVDAAVRTLIEFNITKPSDSERAAELDIADFPESAAENEYYNTIRGETVGRVIEDICEVFGYGYEVYVQANGRFKFRLYEGKDRSYSQEKLPWRTFSPKFNNLLEASFVYDDSEHATGYVICGETESQTINPSTGAVYNWPQVWMTVTEEEATGWDRREKFIDGSNISRWQGDWMFNQLGVPRPSEYVTHGWKKLPESLYRRLLLMKTEEERSYVGDSLEFEGEADTNVQWKLNEDVFLGDIVQVISDYGISARCRITEMIWSEDVNGIKFYPTFEFVMPEEGYGIEWLPPLGANTRSSVILCTTKP